MKKLTLLSYFCATFNLLFGQSSHIWQIGTSINNNPRIICLGDTVHWIPGNTVLFNLNADTNSLNGQPYNNPVSFSAQTQNPGDTLYSHIFSTTGFYQFDIEGPSINSYVTGYIEVVDCSSSVVEVDTIVSCNPINWIDGNFYDSSNNTASFTSQNLSPIELNVLSPSSISGSFICSSISPESLGNSLNMTSTNWGNNIPLMNNPNNFVTDTLMFVEDGTAGTNPQGNPISQEGCNPLINDLTGKIAVIWRNTCQFGTKVLNAQNAGAVAVIIINRESGIVNMAGGNDGNLCNIPAIFIDSLSGSLIANAMINGTVVANIGANPGTNVTTNLNLTIPTSSSTDNINYCETFGAGGNPIPFTWIDGSNHYVSTSGQTYVLTNSAGCDSIITLNLNVFPYAQPIDDMRYECDSLTWINGTTYYNDTIVYDTLQNMNGCDSINVLYFSVWNHYVDFNANQTLLNSPPFAVQFNNLNPDTAATDITYNWDFGDGTILQNNNPSVYHTYQYNGLYSVKLTAQSLDSCIRTEFKSDYIYCVGGPNLSIIEVSNNINVFPNPTNENITISVNDFNGNIQTEVYDLIGNKLQTTNETTISLRDYSKGIYILKVAYGHRVQEVKVIKE